MALAWWLSWVLGCGLTLDYDPPDPQALGGADAASVDGSRRDGGRRRDGAAIDGSDLLDGPTSRDASSILDARLGDRLLLSDAPLADRPPLTDATPPSDAAWLDGYICAGYICGSECCDPRSFEVCCDDIGGGDPYCAGMCL